MTISRRDFMHAAMALPLGTAFGDELPLFHGVLLGTTTYSYRDLDLDATLRAVTAAGFRICEFFERHAFPPKPSAESWPDYNARMKQWALAQPLEHFASIGARFRAAGIRIYSMTHPFREDDSDAEMKRAFEMARALGASYIFSSTQVSLARKLNGLAAENGIPVAFHNHAKAPELHSPEEFDKAMAGNPQIGINLDIGHFVAAGYDPLSFIEKRHARIRGLHIKDRKKNQGMNVPFGEGDTPIREVLQLCQKRSYRIPALIEYEYKGADTETEVRKCFEYMKAAVASA